MKLTGPSSHQERVRRTVASRPAWRIGIYSVLSFSLTACAGYEAFRDGNASLQRGETVVGIQQLKEATQINPDNKDFRRTYYAQRERALNEAMRDMELAIDLGDFERAEQALLRARAIEPDQARVSRAADRIDNARRQWQTLDRAEAAAAANQLDDAVTIVRQVISENPQHRRAQGLLRQLLRKQADRSGRLLGIHPVMNEGFRKPISLTLTNASLLQAFEALKQASGLNFMFDRDVRTDQRVTISVSNKSIEEVLRLLFATNQLERRVLDENTLLIYPNTAQKSRDYQELVVRSFYLANADIKQTATMVRTIAKARDVFVDEKLNLLVVRDTQEVVRLAERLIANQDLADPEVMLELEVMEVSSSRLVDLGIRWPDSVSASVQGAAGNPGELTLPEFRARSSSLIRLQTNDPLVAARLRSQVGDANLLANPRIRVRNRQTAKILIGERVPVITTTATANVGSTQNVNYLDVGLKLEVEPNVSLDDEVGMKIALEVSNILETITRGTAQAYRLGTRNASTQLRVRDGETQILAGLIQRDERRSNDGIPLVNEIPLLSHLFGVGNTSNTKTEIVLLITPRIVRNVELPAVGQIEFLSGTDSANGASPIQLSPVQGQRGGVGEGQLQGGSPGVVAPQFRPQQPGSDAPGSPLLYAPTPPGVPSGLVSPPLVPTPPSSGTP